MDDNDDHCCDETPDRPSNGRTNGSTPANGVDDVTHPCETSRQRSKLGSVKATIGDKTNRFFKIEQDEECQLLWDDRRRRLLGRTCGKMKCDSRKSQSKQNNDVTAQDVRVDMLPRSFNTITMLASSAPCVTDGVVDGRSSSPVRSQFARKSAMRLAHDSIKKQLSPTSQQNDKDVTDGAVEDLASGLRDIHDEIKPIADEDRDVFDDHRPFFTYFVIITQTLITLFAILLYGFGPWGVSYKKHVDQVLVSSMSLQYVEYQEPQNVWLGPPASALIHLGAKFAPCMRKDRLVYEHIRDERLQERNTACCVRNDESGCAQTTEDRCSKLLSTWKRWDSNFTGPDMTSHSPNGELITHRRTSGTVCGQDPRYCSLPASKAPFEWPDDITSWPICQLPLRPLLDYPHMTCEVIAKPCCIGIYGQCRITTQKYCEFVNGHFHEEANLCSQVSCMRDVCGLLPFGANDAPDQFYRIFTSIFLHAGIIHLACSLTFYYIFMRDIERAVGPLRLGIIYISSGIAGNLASATFVPYRAESGPAGSILGVMACLIVIIIYSWNQLKHPYRQLSIKFSIVGVFFLIGLLLPWIDNYAHLAGFIVGFFLSLALIPYVNIGKHYDPQQKKNLIIIGMCIFIFTLLLLTSIFYLFPIYECAWCKYFNCLLSIFSDSFCPDQDFQVNRVDTL